MTATTTNNIDTLNLSTGGTLAGPGRAAHGYDTVSCFTGTPTMGSDKFVIAHEGATYRFVDQTNLDTFTANPGKYVPAFGGFCAFGVSVGKKFDGDPVFSKVVNGKLYFNLNGDIQQAWLADIDGAIDKANANWRDIASKAVGSL
jgi:YHS domain-containing protein